MNGELYLLAPFRYGCNVPIIVILEGDIRESTSEGIKKSITLHARRKYSKKHAFNHFTHFLVKYSLKSIKKHEKNSVELKMLNLLHTYIRVVKIKQFFRNSELRSK